MEQGFHIDMAGGERYVGRWAPGPPQKTFIGRTRVPTGVLPIGSYRCQTCGFIESYARPEFAPQGQRQFSLRALFFLMTIVAVALAIVMAIAERN
jgi:hypothetical protein